MRYTCDPKYDDSLDDESESSDDGSESSDDESDEEMLKTPVFMSSARKNNAKRPCKNNNEKKGPSKTKKEKKRLINCQKNDYARVDLTRKANKKSLC